MNKFKKIFSLVLCLVICLSLSISTLAANNTASIKITNIESAMPGDTVTITISISNNPGIMAMAFCITYDSDSLVYKNYSKGYLSSYTVKDHPDKGHVSFVNVENKDISTDGTIISLLFDVKEDAKPGKHVITLANSNREKYGNKLHNSFSTAKQEYVVPAIVSGGVTVGETCNNSGHDFSEWNEVYPATCTTTGLQNRICSRCTTLEEKVIPSAHDFEEDWTIDKVATPEEDGEMSRHCTKCDQVTDKITFKYEEIVEDDDTSSDTPSDDSASDNTSSDNTSSDNTSSTESSTGNTSDNSGDTSTANKPVINNQVGQKVPLQEVEKIEDYQQNIKPNLNNDSTQSDTTSSEETSSEATVNSSSTTTTGTIENDSSNDSNANNKKDSFYSSPSGIIMIALCSLLSIGILGLGAWLIIKNKK